MATSYITNAQLNSLIVKIDNNFAKKKDSITKVELKNLLAASGLVAEDGLYLVETFVDNGLVDGLGATISHVEYIPVDIEIGGNIKSWASGEDYKVDQLVIYEKEFYRNLSVPVDNTVFDYTEWELISGHANKDTLDLLGRVELHENELDPTEITGYNVEFDGEVLLKEKDLIAFTTSELETIYNDTSARS